MRLNDERGAWGKVESLKIEEEKGLEHIQLKIRIGKKFSLKTGEAVQ